MAAPVETKVQASAGAAAVSGLALWALGHYVFKAGVPDVVASWIYVIVPAAVTFMAGYLAKHTARSAGAPAITVNTTAGTADVGRQVAAAMRAYEGRRPGGMFVDPRQTPTALMEPSMQPGQSDAPESPTPAEKTLMPPAAAAAEQPPAAAGPAEPAAPE